MRYLVGWLIFFGFVFSMNAYSQEESSSRNIFVSEVRSKTIGNQHVELGPDKIKSTILTHLPLKITHVDGTVPNIVPSSGYPVHFILSPRQKNGILHFHPEQLNATDFDLSVLIQDRGYYDVWVEYVDNGVQVNIPLLVKVY